MSITLSMVDERLKNAVSNQLAWDPGRCVAGVRNRERRSPHAQRLR